MRKELILTVGLPRSGKSTWAKLQGCPVVNPDSIRLAIHGEAFVQGAEPFVWATAYTMVNALFLAGHDLVIVDATSITEKARKEWRYKVPQEVDIVYQPFDTSPEECIRRAKEGERYDLVPVIERMAEKMEMPV